MQNSTCITGAYIEGYWEGFEYSSSAIVNQEACKYNKYIDYHDGPITNIAAFPPNPDITITIGGTIFAIWHKDMPNRPILWRKNKFKFTDGNWSYNSWNMIRLTKSDGNIELWDLLSDSCSSVAEQSLSGKMLLCSHAQPMSNVKPVVGVGDYNGSYRMYIFPTALVHGTDIKFKRLSKRLINEIRRIKNIQNWEKGWKKKKAFAEKSQANFIEKPSTLGENVPKKIEKELEGEDKRKRDVVPPAEYKQYVYEKWLEHEKQRMNDVLLSLKRLNPELVKKQQAPLKKLEKEKETKKKKQRARLQRSERIFKENVDMYFPNALQQLPLPPLDPYASVHSKETKNNCFKNYNGLVNVAKDYVKKHPFRYRFQWSQVIKQGIDRRENLDKPYCTSNHRDRYKRSKDDDNSVTDVPSAVTTEEEDVEVEDEGNTQIDA